MASSLNPSMLAGMQELGKHGRVYSLHRSLIYRGHYMITRLWRSFPLLCQILSHCYIAHHLLWSHVRANDTVSTLPAAFSSSWRSEGLCSPSGATPLHLVVVPCSYYCVYTPATTTSTSLLLVLLHHHHHHTQLLSRLPAFGAHLVTQHSKCLWIFTVFG